jgi:hypothetical protein
MNTSVLIHSTPLSDNNRMQNSSLHNHHSIIDSHLVNLYSQLAILEQQKFDSTRLKSLLDSYHYNCLHLKARYKIEEERIDRRFDAETRCTRAHFAAKKGELKEHLLDRLRRKRKLVVEEMRSAIDINSRSFDADPLLVTMQPPHPLQAKAYNFRQRPDMGQGTSNMMDDELISTSGILSPIPQQQTARKRLVGAFSLFQLPKWTVKDDECEDDLKMISNSRK